MNPYSRILLKLSGEALSGARECGYNEDSLSFIAENIKQVHNLGVQIGIVIGAGNLLRGAECSLAIPRTSKDHAGMLATVMNGIILSEVLSEFGVATSVLSAFECGSFVETYSKKKALRLMEKGEVVVFVGGTSNPYFTTDSAAALRAAEIDADILIKASNVDGIYDKDPNMDSDAQRFHKLTHIDVIEKRLAVMDMTAYEICKQKKIPIRVIKFTETNGLLNALKGNIGTLVTTGA